MKITIENTTQIVQVFTTKDMSGPIPARVWKGFTESGIPVQCLVTRIAAPNAANLAEFERELQEQTPAPAPDVPAFPLKLII